MQKTKENTPGPDIISQNQTTEKHSQNGIATCPAEIESIDSISISSDKIVSNAASIDVIVHSKSDISEDAPNTTGEYDNENNENFLKKFYLRKTKGLSSTQIAILCIFPFVEFFAATVISIQGPFYPKVAREKGATPSEYGMVFGVFELTVFICAPIMGGNMAKLKPHRLFNYGIFTTSLCCVVFGFLHHLDGRYPFIMSSIIVRTIEAIGDAGFVVASFSIIASEFTDTLPSTFALMETFYGFGMIFGPTMGGVLYELGGFTLPFVVMGLLLFLSAIATYFFITKPYEENDSGSSVSNSSFEMFRMLKIPVISLTAFGTFAAATGIGFLSNNLQRHLEAFGVNALEVGFIFMLNGGVYALSAPFWGKLIEKSTQPKIFSLIGSLLTIFGFVLIGPLPFIPSWHPTIPVICFGLVIFGLGLGSTLVASFLLFLQDSIANGHPDDVTTHGLVSGLWTSMTALGFFVGPTLGGVLDDKVGFRWGSLFILIEQIILIGLLTYFFVQVRQNSSKNQNDIVTVYELKTDTPKPKSIKERRKERLEMKTDKDVSKRINLESNTAITTKDVDELVATATATQNVSDVANTDEVRCDEGGVENPNFSSD